MADSSDDPEPDSDVVDLLEGIDLTPAARPAVTDRVRIAYLASMLDLGVDAAAGLSDAALASRANTTTKALARAFSGGTAEIRDASIEWAFEQVNRFIMEYTYENPPAAAPGQTDVATSSPVAVASLHGDFIAVLHRMWSDPQARLTATAALLALRRGADMGVTPGREQQRFLTRLGTLASAHLGLTPGSPPALRLRLWLATYLASTWFAWLIDSDLVEAPDYTYGLEHALLGLDQHLTNAHLALGRS